MLSPADAKRLNVLLYRTNERHAPHHDRTESSPGK